MRVPTIISLKDKSNAMKHLTSKELLINQSLLVVEKSLIICSFDSKTFVLSLLITETICTELKRKLKLTQRSSHDPLA